MKRKIVMHGPPDPDDKLRTIYLLECGHSISRRTNHGKRWAICGWCRDTEGQPSVR